MSTLASVMANLARQAVISNPRQSELSWTKEEIDYLGKNAGVLEDEEIGRVLGRSANGVKVKRVRMGLHGVARSGKAWLTGNKVARVLGIDAHKIVYWARVGLLPSIKKVHEESGREYILVSRVALKRWCANPRHWVYFDWRGITDGSLRRLCELRAQRWGDEWWTTNQVAEHHGVCNKDVIRLIDRGEIQAYRPDFSLSGRDLGDAWRYKFVLKSEATRPDLVFIKGSGRPGMSKKFSAGFDAFLIKARDELGLEFQAIARMMKAKDKAVWYRYARLKKSAKDG
jgi:hypothetical protein